MLAWFVSWSASATDQAGPVLPSWARTTKVEASVFANTFGETKARGPPKRRRSHSGTFGSHSAHGHEWEARTVAMKVRVARSDVSAAKRFWV